MNVQNIIMPADLSGNRVEVELVAFPDSGELAVIARSDRLLCLPNVVDLLPAEDLAVLSEYGDLPVDYEPMVTEGWRSTSCWIFARRALVAA